MSHTADARYRFEEISPGAGGRALGGAAEVSGGVADDLVRWK